MVRHDIPTSPTPFVGRVDELAAIFDLLDHPQCRLLTLVGPGGVGKTRLALEAAATVINRATSSAFNDVCYVPLQPLSAPELIFSAVAEALDLRLYPGEEPIQQLIYALRPTTTLLILDNLEHLLDGIGFLPSLLGGAPGIKILTTSRETLNLQEEWLYPIQGMAYPSGGNDLERYDAVQLFVQLARRARPDFSLEAEQPAVLRICQLLEGMPLALEMTAAWLRRLPVQQIVLELEHGLDILENPARNVPSRHRSMRAVFEHSWSLLNPTEQDVLKKLSVFRGGFERAAAEAVAEASLGVLSALVDKSLLRVDAAGRYDFHELARQYAEEQLDAMPAISRQVHDLHCDHFTEFLTERFDNIARLRAKHALDALATELPNVRAAWDWAIEHRVGHALLKIGSSLGRYYNTRWLPADGAEVFGRAVTRLQDQAGRGFELAVARYEKALCVCKLGRFEEARSLNEAIVTEAALEEHPWLITEALVSLCDVCALMGDYERAQQFGQQGVDRLRQERPQTWFLAMGLLYLAKTLHLQAEYSGARERLLEAIAVATELGAPNTAAEARAELGYLELSLHAHQEARLTFAENLALARSFEWRTVVMASLTGLARASMELDDYSEAKTYFSEAIEVGMQWHLVPFVLRALVGISDLLIRQQNWEQAVPLLALVSNHPAASHQPKQAARLLLKQVEARLALNVLAAGLEAAKTLRLDAVVQTLLTQQLSPTPPSPQEAGHTAKLLSQRELEILRHLADGLTNREIAERLFLAASTVKWYTLEIYSKLHVANRTQAVSRARALNLLA